MTVTPPPAGTPLTDESARALVAAVETFTAKLEDTAKATNRNRIWNAVISVVLVLVLVLGTYVFALSLRVSGDSNTVKAVQCSLYGIFLSSYDPNSREARDNPTRYAKSFAQIRADNTRLGCPTPIAPIVAP